MRKRHHYAAWHTCSAESPHGGLPHPCEANATAETLAELERNLPQDRNVYVDWDQPHRRKMYRGGKWTRHGEKS